jgi:hypothetical protein
MKPQVAIAVSSPIIHYLSSLTFAQVKVKRLLFGLFGELLGFPSSVLLALAIDSTVVVWVIFLVCAGERDDSILVSNSSYTQACSQP